MIQNEQPGDGAVDISVTLTQLQFNLSHSHHDVMNFTVTTVPAIGYLEESDVAEGTYTVAVQWSCI